MRCPFCLSLLNSAGAICPYCKLLLPHQRYFHVYENALSRDSSLLENSRRSELDLIALEEFEAREQMRQSAELINQAALSAKRELELQNIILNSRNKEIQKSSNKVRNRRRVIIISGFLALLLLVSIAGKQVVNSKQNELSFGVLCKSANETISKLNTLQNEFIIDNSISSGQSNALYSRIQNVRIIWLKEVRESVGLSDSRISLEKAIESSFITLIAGFQSNASSEKTVLNLDQLNRDLKLLKSACIEVK